jgi:hypothetical protein
VAEVRKARDARNAEAEDVPLGTGDAALDVDVRHLELPVGIPGEERHPGSSAGAAERPVVAAAGDRVLRRDRSGADP